jgi:serine phosphatase RsbU (regulator of sigma subunit)
MRAAVPWRSTPLRARIIFLAAVFCVFVGIGIANDITDMGRWSTPRYAISVVLIGVFAMGYAASGIILRNRFWKAMLPLMAVQFTIMGFLANHFPNAPQQTQLNKVQMDRLHSRMSFDGIAVIITVCLGYIGFVHVSISEARRYAKTQTEKATLDGEMAAAREVQRVMVPEVLPSISGYAIESVYRPAAEVGGDFLQMIGLKSGRTLLVIGDVSGKGLSAAMIVSMIVGMLGVVTSFTEEPAEILSELNRRLCGRAHGGFATCLIVRLEAGGRLTLANAGHPPPFVNGAELSSPGSMPLGMTESAAYTQSSLDLLAGDRAVLLTDGVPEARNQTGVLLGFPGVESLLRQGASVHAVAQAAQQFGQDDDLTVISSARQA